MKQRKIVSMMGALVVLFLTASLMTGCGALKKIYAGNYEGTFDGHASGNWIAVVSPSGHFTGVFTMSGIDYPASGEVSAFGKVSGSLIAAGETLMTFEGRIFESTINGTWEFKIATGSGAFTGRRRKQ